MSIAKNSVQQKRVTAAKSEAARAAKREVQRKANIATQQTKAAVVIQKNYRASKARELRNQLILEQLGHQKAQGLITKAFMRHIFNEWLKAREEQEEAASAIQG